jgi:hypothetical protein
MLKEWGGRKSREGLVAAGEEAGDPDQDNCAERGGGQTTEKSERGDPQARENPASDDGADQAKKNIHEAAEAATSRELSGKPSGDKAHNDPGEPTVESENNEMSLLLEG